MRGEALSPRTLQLFLPVRDLTSYLSFDKIRVVPGTFVRGEALSLELALTKEKKGTKSFDLIPLNSDKLINKLGDRHRYVLSVPSLYIIYFVQSSLSTKFGWDPVPL